MFFTVTCTGVVSPEVGNKFQLVLECGHRMLCDRSSGDDPIELINREIECHTCRKAYFESLGMME